MAEIPVQKKSSMSWLWLLLGLLLVALIIWWLLADDDEVETDVIDSTVVEQVEPVTGPETGELPMTLAAILAQPQSYVGQQFSGEVDVGGPLTDRGFWIENDGARMFAIIIDEPREVPLDINAGQRLQVSGGVIRDADDISNIEGVPLDEDTKMVINDQAVFMIVNEDNIEILERPSN
ncbi:MAG: hypothetical protein COA41_06505 [Sphingopyxis sp.]|nr:MAG: hypothetical protein COA41_06505 [Sphingopyxis sp.]